MHEAREGEFMEGKMKRKVFKPKSPNMRRWGAEATRAFNKWHAVDSADQPKFEKKPRPVWERRDRDNANRALRAIVLYAAAIGQKRGVLPLDLSAWEASSNFDYSGATDDPVLVVFRNGACEVPIRVDNLDWKPAEPVEELVA